MRQVIVSERAPDSAEHLGHLSRLDGGAVASFTGIVRGDDGVAAITLEHYPAMTQNSLEAMVEEACGRWSLLGAIVEHRVGQIAKGEPIVFVGTAAAHRHAALDACAFLIDRLKTDAPFWKKESLVDGENRWVEERASDHSSSDRWKV